MTLYDGIAHIYDPWSRSVTEDVEFYVGLAREAVARSLSLEPLAAGRFGLDEYTEHVMQFLRVLGPGAHLMAICQPTVASLAAVALMSEG